MSITIESLNLHNLHHAGQCDSTFTVTSKLILGATDNHLHYTIEPVASYQKQYPSEITDYSTYSNNPDQVVFLAYLDNHTAGELILKCNWNNYAWIDNLVVDTAHRRRGIAQELIKTAIAWARKKQLPGLMLETQNNNVPACLLYERCGFKLSGFDTQLYKALHPDTDEIALFWYLIF
jgi:streptothricin acetyltransferase